MYVPDQKMTMKIHNEIISCMHPSSGVGDTIQEHIVDFDPTLKVTKKLILTFKASTLNGCTGDHLDCED